MDSAVSFGSTLLGAFLGRRSVLGRAATSARSAGRARREALDVGRAEETAAAIGEQLRELESRFEFDLAEAQARLDPLAEELETLTVRLKKTGISLRLVALAWAPYWEAEDGASPAW